MPAVYRVPHWAPEPDKPGLVEPVCEYRDTPQANKPFSIFNYKAWGAKVMKEIKGGYWCGGSNWVGLPS